MSFSAVFKDLTFNANNTAFTISRKNSVINRSLPDITLVFDVIAKAVI